MKERIKCGNPYMPLWEHVPDGEPRVFEHNGERRVYVYGSHDTMRTEYCGDDYVVWSAPVSDLPDWTCHGVCYRATDGSVLFAPDVVKRGDTYYLYAAEARGSRIMVAKSSSPTGPFTDPVRTDLGFDPSVLVDDDGRAYAYWGFCESHCGELAEDMATIKPGTYRAHPIGHCRGGWIKESEHIDEADGFFEAASQRKIMGKYVLIYSKRYDDPVPELGVTPPCSGFLSYKYSDEPLSGFVAGGDISFNGGIVTDTPSGGHACTYKWGNNHGSLCEIEGQWYIFYHRQTGTDEFSRQAMAEPVEVELHDGKLYIGKIERDGDSRPVSSRPVEMTSSGLIRGGLPADKIIPAAYACGMSGGAYVLPVRDMDADYPVVGITSGAWVGFRYIDFGITSPGSVTVRIRSERECAVTVRVDSYDGPAVAVTDGSDTAELLLPVTGKRAVFFEFSDRAEFLDFSFNY